MSRKSFVLLVPLVALVSLGAPSMAAALTISDCDRCSQSQYAGGGESGISQGCPCGDVNFDGVANTTDALLIVRGRVTDPEALARCNVSGDPDHMCNTTDALIIARGLVGSAQLEPVSPGGGIAAPEPTSTVLFAVGALVVAGALRKKAIS